jgi:D-sedoheptulose 7-phosphate isomerase
MTTPLKTQHALESIFESSGSSEAYAAGFLERLIEVIKKVDPAQIARAIDVIEQAQIDNRAIFVFGNGGSAAVASHIVNDLSANSLVKGKRGYRAYALADNVESVTAIANDTGFENIFSHQLEAQMNPGDVAVAISVSGNSENVIRAVDYANAHGATTIGLCGFEGGRLKEKVQIAVHVPTSRDEYGPAEDLFSNLGHVITGYLSMKRGKKLYH